MMALAVLGVALVVALGLGLWWRARNGQVNPTKAAAPETDSVLERLLLTRQDGTPRPVVLHFSAAWCGPCVAVRGVVSAVAEELGAADWEVDLESVAEHGPELAGELGVLSLPTTFVFDADLRQRFRIAGVPTTADLRRAVSAARDTSALQ